MISRFKQKIKTIIQNLLSLDIQTLSKGRGIENDRYSYQKQYINFAISTDDKVLDIGSGGYPFPLATHLADFYEGDTTHRYEILKRDDRPFINCNIEQTPFADKEFDFV